MKCKTGRVFLLIFLAVAVCGQAFGLHQVAPSQHAHHVSKRRSRLRRILWNPVFRPSRDSLLRQNEEIDRLELPRIQNQAELDQLIASQDLVPIVASQTLRYYEDPATGAVLWHASLQANVSNGPVTYELDGVQYVVVAAGDTLYGFAK